MPLLCCVVLVGLEGLRVRRWWWCVEVWRSRGVRCGDVDLNVEMMSGVIFLKWSTRDVGRYMYASMGENGSVAYRIII